MVGTDVHTLVPLGVPAEHTSFGIIPRQDIFVPFAPPSTYVQVQMAAWDGTLWGTDFAAVPRDQLGFTDIVPVYPAFRALCLQPSTEPATHWDCPHECGCLHSIILHHDATGAIAICRCEPPSCPDIHFPGGRNATIHHPSSTVPSTPSAKTAASGT